jgi:hypothetical protein
LPNFEIEHHKQFLMQRTVKKIVGAALVGSVVMFIWGGFSHMVLFVGAGFKHLPNEDNLIATLKTNKDEQGLYFFPGKEFRHSTKEEDLAWENKFRNGPAGLIVYKAVGGDPFSAGKLIIQFLSNFSSVLIAAFIAASVSAGYWRRVLIVTLLGVAACSSVSTIYWNWYGFPNDFFMAQLADMTIGFFLAGLVVCKMVNK